MKDTSILENVLSIEKLIYRADELFLNTKNTYIQSYPEFIKYFNNIDLIEKHHLIISTHFVYGWMPTILNLDISNLQEFLDILNKVKLKKEMENSEILFLKKHINNSLVGTSKLLHFICPEKYAIWDSKIYRYLYNKKPYGYRVGDVNLYKEYIATLKRITMHEKFYLLLSIVETKLKYKVSPIRAIEIVMFSEFK